MDIKELKTMTLEDKIRILAKMFTKGCWTEDDPDIDILLDLADYWDDIYDENRVLSFIEARIIANQHVIAKVLSECDHDFVYKTLHDHTAADICTKCGNIKKQV